MVYCKSFGQVAKAELLVEGASVAANTAGLLPRPKHSK
jgi:hypothetical protein